MCQVSYLAKQSLNQPNSAQSPSALYNLKGRRSLLAKFQQLEDGRGGLRKPHFVPFGPTLVWTVYMQCDPPPSRAGCSNTDFTLVGKQSVPIAFSAAPSVVVFSLAPHHISYIAKVYRSMGKYCRNGFDVHDCVHDCINILFGAFQCIWTPCSNSEPNPGLWIGPKLPWLIWGQANPHLKPK